MSAPAHNLSSNGELKQIKLLAIFFPVPCNFLILFLSVE